jgi:hypothetical protein
MARESLLSIFRQKFEEASRSRDSTTTSRFFKLFPEIGWEAEGLEAYASFVVDLVRIRAPASAKGSFQNVKIDHLIDCSWTLASSPLYYITALTALFESIAMIVDQHQPVVEKYYGPGKMRSVVERLLQECDRVVGGVVRAWEEERSIKRKVCRQLSDTIFQCMCSTGPVSSLTSQTIRQFQCFLRATEDLRLTPALRTLQLIRVILTGYYRNWRE